jgi:hypothetical protein
MDWKKYHRLNVIYAFFDELEKDYPAICTVSVIGKSVEGRDIKVIHIQILKSSYTKIKIKNIYVNLFIQMLKISNSNASNSAVWLDASIHPREWITTAVVTYIADKIVRNFNKLSSSITNKDWYSNFILIKICVLTTVLAKCCARTAKPDGTKSNLVEPGVCIMRKNTHLQVMNA